jgi:hypothetical protein
MTYTLLDIKIGSLLVRKKDIQTVARSTVSKAPRFAASMILRPAPVKIIHWI